VAGDPRLDAAQRYLARGIQPLPIPERQKAPTIPNWPEFRANSNAAEFFAGPGNLGVLLGDPSGGIVDVDLDAPEALALAPYFLPATEAVFGHASKPRSHLLYVVQPAPSTTRFSGLDGASLVELRSTGAQTIFPPSTHPSGEIVEWHRDGEPAHLDTTELLSAVRRLAMATLLVRHYPAEGSRHEFALAISGALVRAGWTTEEIAHLLRAVGTAAGDPETCDRARAGEYSAKRITSGRPATGWTRLEKLIGRDVAHRLREWLSLAELELHNGAEGEVAPYRVQEGRIVHLRQTEHGQVSTPLSNFNASVKEELVLDDGRETTRSFQIEGQLADGKSLPAIRVPVEKFSSLGWVVENWGVRAVVSAGLGSKDRLREAIQCLSGEVPTRRVFAHTGWTCVDGAWLFLSAGGAVGHDGVEVSLPADLRTYTLPTKPIDVCTAMKGSLRLLDIAPLSVTAPLWAGMFRAPLASTYPLDVSLFVAGATGVCKSTLAALFLSHFGKFERTLLPGSWSSTANQLEHRAFVLKDMPFVVDDYAPTPLDARDLEAKAARLLRAQGNLSARGRLRSDLSEHLAHPPRGLIIATGEQHPTGQSILARTLIVSVEPGTVNMPVLSELQEVASQLPHAMSGYIAWLASQMEKLPKLLGETFSGARARGNGAGSHLRVPEALAHLWLGVNAGLQFAEEIGAVSSGLAQEHRSNIWAALVELGEEQSHLIDGERASRRFLQVLSTLLTQGRALLLPKERKPDENLSRADLVGWYDDESVFLLPEAAYLAVARFCRDSGEAFPVRRDRLLRDLKREGVSECETRHTTTNTRVGGQVRRVLRLRRSALNDAGQETVGGVPTVPGFPVGRD
jgi:hypothetical protein